MRVNAAILIAAVASLAFWIFTSRSFLAYQLTVGGLAAAARYAGFSADRTVWVSLVLSGLTAGLAGVGEVAGPVGQLNLNISPGYGFAAIIVAYLGRLNAIGIVLAGLLMALLYLGGEAAQVALQLPAAITGLFQGMLLFFLLGADVFVDYRLPRPAETRQLHLPADANDTTHHAAEAAPTEADRTPDPRPRRHSGRRHAADLRRARRAGGRAHRRHQPGRRGHDADRRRRRLCRGRPPGGGALAGLPAGAVAGMLAALIFAILSLSMAANQAACGLALTIFGIGLSAFIGQHYVSYSLPGLPPLDIPGLSEIPVIGRILFHQDAVTYLGLVTFVGVWWVLRRPAWA
jgi:ABC-type uncharacterized transport system permease subunit